MILRKIKRFFLSFIESNGKPQPVYVWAQIFLVLIVVTWILKLFNSTKAISDSLLISMLSFVAVWLGLFNLNKANKRKHDETIKAFEKEKNSPPSSQPGAM